MKIIVIGCGRLGAELAFRLYQPWLGRIGERPGRVWSLLRHLLHSLPQQGGLFWRSWLWTP